MIDIITSCASTGLAGEGKIFVSNIEDSVDIGTKKRGSISLWIKNQCLGSRGINSSSYILLWKCKALILTDEKKTCKFCLKYGTRIDWTSIFTKNIKIGVPNVENNISEMENYCTSDGKKLGMKLFKNEISLCK